MRKERKDFSRLPMFEIIEPNEEEKRLIVQAGAMDNVNRKLGGCNYCYSIWNIIAVWLHLISAGTMAIIYVTFDNNLVIPYTEMYQGWESVKEELYFVNCTNTTVNVTILENVTRLENVTNSTTNVTILENVTTLENVTNPENITNCLPVVEDITESIWVNGTYDKWEEYKPYINKSLPYCDGTFQDTNENGKFCIGARTKTFECGDDPCGLDYGWLIISFHLLSAFFQGLAWASDTQTCKNCGIDRIYSYEYAVAHSQNPLRFIEYSISAAIMLVVIALLNGIYDIHILVSIAVLTSSCQLSGLAFEYIYEWRLGLKWVVHLNGWLTFLCAYGIIFRAFFASVEVAADGDGVVPPDFVYAIVFGLFAMYGSFGFVQLTELFCLTCKCCDTDKDKKKLKYTENQYKAGKLEALTKARDASIRDMGKELNKSLIKGLRPKECWSGPLRYNGRCNPFCKEMVYVLLSLVAKNLLGWILFFNLFMRNDD